MHIDRCIVYASIVYLCHGIKCTMWPTAAQAPKYHQPQPHWLSSSSSVCLHIQVLLLPSATTCNGEPELEWVATDWHFKFQMNACHTPHHWSVTGPSHNVAHQGAGLFSCPQWGSWHGPLGSSLWLCSTIAPTSTQVGLTKNLSCQLLTRAMGLDQ